MEKIKSHRKLKIALITVCAFLLLVAVMLALMYLKIIKLNEFKANNYSVKGCDVSMYQGEIDWEKLSQSVDFAFIKATEGSEFVDDCFVYNYENAAKTSLKVGVYHFFSYDSSGDKQAESFIKTVKKDENSLPPVIDVEFYGEYEKEPCEKSKAVENIRQMADKLYEYYGKKPIIYTTTKAYRLYIKDNFDDCGLWIRDVYFSPDFTTDEWDFWQYSDTQILDGYSGEEKYIDMNVYKGSLEELNKL